MWKRVELLARQAHRVQDVAHASVHPIATHTRHYSRLGQGLPNGSAGIHARIGILKHDLHSPRQLDRLPAVRMQYINALQPHVAGIGGR